MRNYFCGTCFEDSGKVGFFRKRVCPECNGEPEKTWLKKHPRPQMPPPCGGSGVKNRKLIIEIRCI